MKFNKLYMALGVAALALASCSDEEDYTPAAAVVTPPAYFNISDNTEVDLEKNSTEFSFPIYRAEAGGAYSPDLAIEIVSGDGVSSATAPFTYLNGENDPIFAEGATTGAIKYAVDMALITDLNDYKFLIKAEGESTPYFITTKEFVVSYVPWVDMKDPGSGVLPTLEENGMWQCLQNGPSMTLDVVVEKHPQKSLFRVTHPYLNAPGVINQMITDGTFAEYYLDPNDPNYLYINTDNPDAVFFCDRDGNLATVPYETGIRGIYNENWIGYGDFLILNAYWYFINNKPYMVDETSGYKPEMFEKAKGQFKGDQIVFGEEGVWYCFTKDKEPVWDCKGWVLKLPGAAQLGWASLGEGSITDGFVYQYWDQPELPTWSVAMMESETEPGKFRLQNPYRSGNFPDADSSTDAPGDGPWNIVIDCTDPNFVIIEPQATGFLVGTEQYIANAAGYYTTSAAQKLSKEQVIANGWNDTYDAATRTITINHPMISGDAGSTWSKVWEETTAGSNGNPRPAVIVLPGEGAQAAPAKPISANKISFARARKASKISR